MTETHAAAGGPNLLRTVRLRARLGAPLRAFRTRATARKARHPAQVVAAPRCAAEAMIRVTLVVTPAPEWPSMAVPTQARAAPASSSGRLALAGRVRDRAIAKTTNSSRPASRSHHRAPYELHSKAVPPVPLAVSWLASRTTAAPAPRMAPHTEIF